MKHFVLLFFFIIMNPIYSQEDSLQYSNPLDIPMYLSGNFGELRSNHFHTGMDIKTQGREGFPVKSVQDGWVSRINVALSGYGNAIYIDHPNGQTSVYAHLQKFNDTVSNFLINAQYDLNQYCVQLYPSQGQIPIKKGEIIGLSGNSGRSGGPHLHFEIRDTESEKPINPQLLGFEFKDEVKPIVQALMLIPLDENASINNSSSRTVIYTDRSTGNCSLTQKSPIKIAGKVGFAIKTKDQYSGSSNSCGTYSIELYKNGELVFEQIMDTLDFSTNRYINSHIVYDYFKDNKSRFQRNYLLPNNELNIYGAHKNNGIFDFKEGSKQTFKYIFKDISGNESILSFEVEGVQSKKSNQTEIQNQEIFHPLQDNVYKAQDLIVYVPKKRIYDKFEFTHSTSTAKKDMLIPIHHIGDPKIPLQNEIIIKFKSVNLDPTENRYTAVRYNQSKDRVYSKGGQWDNGYWEFRTKDFGSYSMMIDSTQPYLKMKNFKQDMRKANSISFKVGDDLSGLKEYDMYIDDEWVLGEYYPKSNTLIYRFDPSRINHGEHKIKVILKDSVGNTNEWSSQFSW